MSGSLFDAHGVRRYIAPSERVAFVKTALNAETEIAAFCLTLVITGARISEVLALTKDKIDVGEQGVIFQTLKQRGKKRFRLVPAPSLLIGRLITLSIDPNDRLWNFGRTYAWHRVKTTMKSAGIGDHQCQLKALRHGFAINAVLSGVPLNILQRWMGHARIETTSIYADALGEEERLLARRTWKTLNPVLVNTVNFQNCMR